VLVSRRECMEFFVMASFQPISMRDVLRFLFCTLWTALAVFGVGHHSFAQNRTAKEPQPIAFYGEGYVLLQHGNVIHGFVKPHADRITIALDKGNEVTVPNRQILTVGKNLEALYTFQMRAIRKWGTGEHWHLAQWCIQNGLLDQAIEHYTELEKTASASPKFKQLDLQLRQALLADSTVQQVLEERGIPNPIVPASYEEMTPSPDTLAGEHRKDAQLESDRIPRVVPGYLRRNFQTEVLPILVSRCGQSGCHGMLSKNDFQIFQPVGEQAALLSQRNLEAIVSYVDHKEPMQTSLIQYAIRPHGSQRNPSIQPNREEDRVLLDKIFQWLTSLAESESGIVASEPAPVTPAMALIPRNTVQQHRRKTTGDSPQQDRNAKLSKPPRSAPPPVILNVSELKEIEEAIDKLEQQHQEKNGTRDPFDPSVFNARFSSERSSKPSK
jgi:hypothetical protein